MSSACNTNRIHSISRHSSTFILLFALINVFLKTLNGVVISSLLVAECFYLSKNLLTEFGYGTFVCGLRKHLLD